MNCDLLNQDTVENKTRKAVQDYLEAHNWLVYHVYSKSDMYCLKWHEYPLWVIIIEAGKKPTEEQMAFINLVNSLTLCGTRAIWCDSLGMFIPLFNDLINGYGVPKK